MNKHRVFAPNLRVSPAQEIYLISMRVSRDVLVSRLFKSEPQIRAISSARSWPSAKFTALATWLTLKLFLVGAPHIKDVMQTMRKEHCEKAGFNQPFTTSNYGITTWPSREWAIVEGSEQGPAEDLKKRNWNKHLHKWESESSGKFSVRKK